ncbi:MAG: hypothetical protein PHP03_03345 [Candidatus Pacebacteria bacterium]|nr:hypothetical protein [Candidatus Paceibacterota bacterium]
MKNKLIIIISVVAVVVLAAVSFYFINKNKPSINSPENASEAPQATESAAETNSPVAEQTPKKLVTDDFSVDIPTGWEKIEPPTGISAMIVKTNENITDPAAQKANFKSYFAVSHNSLKEASMDTYLNDLKNELKKTFPTAVFSNEQNTIINNSPAHAMEADLTQQGINYKVLLVVIKGQGEDIWVVSFNTLQSIWNGYKEVFGDIAKSFIVKI